VAVNATINKENNMAIEPKKLGSFEEISEAAREFIRKSGPTTQELKKQAVDRIFAGDLNNRFLEARDLLVKKHKDYGPKNISHSPGGALNGLRVRIHDKLARINHLLDTGATPENESLRDSFMDMANYAIIGLMVLDGVWDKEIDTADLVLGSPSITHPNL
jgi:hypothetical protein